MEPELGQPVENLAAPHAPSDGLVGHWRFDEEQGLEATDASGNQNHGRLIHAQRGTGAFLGSVDLAGANDSHVSVPGSATLNGSDTAISVSVRAYARSFKVEVSGAATYIVLVSRQVGELLHPDQYFLGFGPDLQDHHTNRFKWHMGTTGGDGDIYVGVPATARWVHMVGTYDGSWMRLYVDGVEIGSTAIVGRIRVDNNPVTIGGEENGPAPGVVDNEFDGYVDDVRIYNCALSADEVRVLFEAVSAAA